MSDRVLAIDDEPGVLRLLSRALRSEGLEIDTATNGEEGLRLALTGSYSVVILDLLMPGTDGMSVLRRLMRLRPGCCACEASEFPVPLFDGRRPTHALPSGESPATR